MTSETFSKRVYELSVIAGMNQRYHQTKAYAWWRWDTIAKIGTAFFAVAGLSLALACWLIEHASPTLHVSEIIVAAIAAFGAIVLNVVPFAEWEGESSELVRRWTALRIKVGELDFEIGESGELNEGAVDKLRRLECLAEKITGSEALADQRLLDTCLESEERSRGVECEAKAA